MKSDILKLIPSFTEEPLDFQPVSVGSEELLVKLAKGYLPTGDVEEDGRPVFEYPGRDASDLRGEFRSVGDHKFVVVAVPFPLADPTSWKVGIVWSPYGQRRGGQGASRAFTRWMDVSWHRQGQAHDAKELFELMARCDEIALALVRHIRSSAMGPGTESDREGVVAPGGAGEDL